MQRNVLKQITNIILVGAFLLPHSVVLAEAIHEERSKYRDITVTQVGDRRCLLSVSYTHLTLPTIYSV